MNCVIILAGGTGERTGYEIPKQFIESNGKPVIAYTLDKFEKCKSIDLICVVCVESWIERLNGIVEKYKIKKVKYICAGSNTGLKSLEKGIQALSVCVDEDLVLIHDAVRPFIDEESIMDNIKVAQKKGCAVTCVPCFETLVYSEDAVQSSSVISREHLLRVLTPQTFRYGTIKRILNESDLDTVSEPSFFALYTKREGKVFCSKGNSKNIKITHASDIQYFKNLFSSGNKEESC